MYTSSVNADVHSSIVVVLRPVLWYVKCEPLLVTGFGQGKNHLVLVCLLV